MPFTPALIVVDFQQDFCPPDGALAVPHGRAIAPAVNALLALPFALRIATRDWHPPDHISFAANHPDADAAADAAAVATVVHPDDPARSYPTRLWPTHCVQGSPGAQLVPELHLARVHAVVDKGRHPRVEMYSAFYDPFRVSDSGLAGMLRRRRVTHVFVAGLAADYCVRATAEHAVDEGFVAYVVDEATRPVCPGEWAACREALARHGVGLVSVAGDEVGRVRALGGSASNAASDAGDEAAAAGGPDVRMCGDESASAAV
ncbi:uncharacterized protein UV8b_01663 [Ustilaginoidea virens]|uniref:nicotinamidase n=1 Tax=Ustilaginoidea virens TaxID=1159556 RepID=A0A8E5MFG2_USTVR|nr:uncharacterized protein UV8b_01663 [Ustilaginoidea virens]QUC17422.1 hypothetical protein UV8b_01663 [Ustilaginoidea virens]